MPAAIPAVIAIGGSVAGATIGGALGFAVMLGSSLLANYISAKQMDDLTGNQGTQVNSRNTEEVLKIIYGQTRVGGNDVYLEVEGVDNKYLWCVQTIGEGPLEGVLYEDSAYQAFINEDLISDVDSADYWFHAGTASQTVDSNLSAVTDWDDPLHYTSYIVWKLTYNTDEMMSFPSRTSVIQGRTLYDFRDTSTAWSQNGVLALYDYLTNTRYGLGISSSLIDTTSWTAAANYIDTKGWTFDIAFTVNMKAMDVINTILTHIRCQLIEYNQKFYLKYLDATVEASVMTLTDDDIVNGEDGKSTISLSEPSRFDTPDCYAVQYTDPAKDYAIDTIYIGEVNGNIKALQLLGCTDRDMALELGYYYLERDKLNRVVTGVFRDYCNVLEPHDLITLSCTWLGISSQEMRIVSSTILENGFVQLQMVYESDDLYNTSYDPNVDDVYTCTLPTFTEESPSVTNVSVTWEGADGSDAFRNRLRITYDVPTSGLFDHVLVWVSTDGGSTWQNTNKIDHTGEIVVNGLGSFWNYGDTVDVFLQAFNQAGIGQTGAVSQGSDSIGDPIAFSSFYSGDTAIWGGNVAIDNASTTIVFDASVPKIALGAYANLMDLDNFATYPGFYVDGSGSFRGGNATSYLQWDVSSGELTIEGAVIASTSDIAGTASDTYTINSDLDNANVQLILGRTSGGNATIQWNGSTLSFDKSFVIPDGGYIGSVSDFNAIQIEADGDVVLTQDLYVSTITQSGTLTINPSSLLNLSPTGDIVLYPSSGDVYPYIPYATNLGLINKKFLTLHAAELWVETLVAQETMCTIGGRILIAPSTELTSDLSPAGTTISVKHNNLNNGDRIYLESGGNVEFMAIISSATGTGPYSYSVTRDLDGTGANTWYRGSGILNTGSTGDGFIDIYSIRGVKSASDYGPTIVGNVRNSSTYNDWTEAWAIGNLNGLYGYGTDTYGVGLGKYSVSNYMTVDPTNGIRFFDSSDVQQAQLTGSVWTLGSTSDEYIQIDAAYGIQMITGGSNYVTLSPSGNLKLGAGSYYTNIDGTNGVRMYSGGGDPYVHLTTAGVLTLGQVSSSDYVTVSSSGISMRSGGNVHVRLSNTTGILQLGYTTGGEYVQIDSTGVEMYAGGVKYTELTNAGVLYLGYQSAEHVKIDSTGMTIYDGATQLANYGSTITIGQVAASQNNILISSGALYFRNNTTNIISITSGGVPTIALPTSGQITMAGNDSTPAKIVMSGSTVDCEQYVNTYGNYIIENSYDSTHYSRITMSPYQGSSAVVSLFARYGSYLGGVYYTVDGTSNYFGPSYDNATDLGASFARYDDVYATNGTIQTSDIREKSNIKTNELGLNFIRLIDTIAFTRKGGTRIHYGLSAQQIVEALKVLNIDMTDFAGVIYDENTDIYGLRYDEFIPSIIKAIQELDARLN